MRKIAAYLASHTEYGGARPEFLGKGGAGWVEGIGRRCECAPHLHADHLRPGLSDFRSAHPLPLVCEPVVEGCRHRLENEFWPSVGFLMGQLALTVVTLSFYWPVAFVKCLAYFAGKTAFERGADGDRPARL